MTRLLLNNLRPLAPHLLWKYKYIPLLFRGHYKTQITSFFSVLHRFTGIVLAIYVGLFSCLVLLDYFLSPLLHHTTLLKARGYRILEKILYNAFFEDYTFATPENIQYTIGFVIFYINYYIAMALPFIIILFIFCLFHHILSGIRHLFFDRTLLLTPSENSASAKIIAFFTVLLSFFSIYVIFATKFDNIFRYVHPFLYTSFLKDYGRYFADEFMYTNGTWSGLSKRLKYYYMNPAPITFDRTVFFNQHVSPVTYNILDSYQTIYQTYFTDYVKPAMWDKCKFYLDVKEFGYKRANRVMKHELYHLYKDFIHDFRPYITLGDLFYDAQDILAALYNRAHKFDAVETGSVVFKSSQFALSSIALGNIAIKNYFALLDFALPLHLDYVSNGIDYHYTHFRDKMEEFGWTDEGEARAHMWFTVFAWGGENLTLNLIERIHETTVTHTFSKLSNARIMQYINSNISPVQLLNLFESRNHHRDLLTSIANMSLRIELFGVFTGVILIFLVLWILVSGFRGFVYFIPFGSMFEIVRLPFVFLFRVFFKWTFVTVRTPTVSKELLFAKVAGASHWVFQKALILFSVYFLLSLLYPLVVVIGFTQKPDVFFAHVDFNDYNFLTPNKNLVVKSHILGILARADFFTLVKDWYNTLSLEDKFLIHEGLRYCKLVAVPVKICYVDLKLYTVTGINVYFLMFSLYKYLLLYTMSTITFYSGFLIIIYHASIGLQSIVKDYIHTLKAQKVILYLIYLGTMLSALLFSIEYVFYGERFYVPIDMYYTYLLFIDSLFKCLHNLSLWHFSLEALGHFYEASKCYILGNYERAELYYCKAQFCIFKEAAAQAFAIETKDALQEERPFSLSIYYTATFTNYYALQNVLIIDFCTIILSYVYNMFSFIVKAYILDIVPWVIQFIIGAFMASLCISLTTQVRGAIVIYFIRGWWILFTPKYLTRFFVTFSFMYTGNITALVAKLKEIMLAHYHGYCFYVSHMGCYKHWDIFQQIFFMGLYSFPSVFTYFFCYVHLVCSTFSNPRLKTFSLRVFYFCLVVFILNLSASLFLSMYTANLHHLADFQRTWPDIYLPIFNDPIGNPITYLLIACQLIILYCYKKNILLFPKPKIKKHKINTKI